MKKWYFFFALFALLSIRVNAQEKIDLAGYWWYTTDEITAPSSLIHKGGRRISLPGFLLTNREGGLMPLALKETNLLNDSSYFLDSFMARPHRSGVARLASLSEPETNYVGTVWYWKSVCVPKEWKRSRVILFLGQPHVATTVYVNGSKVGQSLMNSLPYQYDITSSLSFGGMNQIAVEVNNGIRSLALDTDSGTGSSVEKGNWNGIGGRIELLARAKQAVLKVRVGEYDEQKHSLQVFLQGDKGFEKGLKFLLEDSPVKVLGVEGRPGQDGAESREYHLSCFLDKWDEFHPNTYELGVVIKRDTMSTVFGVRDISAKGGEYYINGRSVSFHGTVADSDFSLTAYLSTDVDFWFNLFKHYKEQGINVIRFHHHFPPEAAFTAADCLGFYLEMEGPAWPYAVGSSPGETLAEQNRVRESKHIVDIYGNHPSFVMMFAANDSYGKTLKKDEGWIRQMSRYDPRRIYCEVADDNRLALEQTGEEKSAGDSRGGDGTAPAFLQR